MTTLVILIVLWVTLMMVVKCKTILDGFYDFSTNPIDLGAIYNSYVTTSMTSSRFNENSLFDSFEGLFDEQTGDF